MDENTMAANAAVNTAVDAVTQPEDSAAAVMTEQVNELDVTKTQTFARRLREQSAAEADKAIAAVGFTNPITGKPIMNRQDLLAFKRMQEAEQLGKDPEDYAVTSELRSQLADYQLREQEQAIKENPRLAPLYEQFKEDAHAIVEQAKSDGSEISLEAALKVLISENLDAVLEKELEKARSETVRSYNAQAAASPGSLGGSDTNNTDVASMSDESFEAYLKKVMRGDTKL